MLPGSFHITPGFPVCRLMPSLLTKIRKQHRCLKENRRLQPGNIQAIDLFSAAPLSLPQALPQPPPKRCQRTRRSHSGSKFPRRLHPHSQSQALPQGKRSKTTSVLWSTPLFLSLPSKNPQVRYCRRKILPNQPFRYQFSEIIRRNRRALQIRKLSFQLHRLEQEIPDSIQNPLQIHAAVCHIVARHAIGRTKIDGEPNRSALYAISPAAIST